MHFQDSRISVVIPSFRVRAHILGVLSRIGPEVAVIYVVDDCCPEQSKATATGRCTRRCGRSSSRHGWRVRADATMTPMAACGNIKQPAPLRSTVMHPFCKHARA